MKKLKEEHLPWSCIFRETDRLNLPCFLDFDEMTTYKKLLVSAGKRQVWFLYRNDAIGRDEMELVSGFALGDCMFGKTGASKMELGWKSGNGGKGPLLSWVPEADGRQ